MRTSKLHIQLIKISILCVITFWNHLSYASSARYDVGDLRYTIDTENQVADLCGLVNPSASINNLKIPDFIEYEGTQIPVVSIKENAFYGQTNLTETLTIGNNIISIGDNAFYGCNSLTGITFPPSVKEIGIDAFAPSDEGSPYLTSRIDITDLKSWLDIDFKSWDSNPLRNAHNIYLNGELITKINRHEWPNFATKVKDFVMGGAFCLEEVYLPDPITEIGQCAFNNCRNLSHISLPSFLKKIGNRALAATSLTEFNFPSTLTTLEYGALGQSKIKEITIPNHITLMEGPMFMYSSELETVRIGDGIDRIGINCFADCPKLRVIYMGENIKEIEFNAFDNDENLEEVHISNLSDWCNIEFEYIHSNPLSYAKALYLDNTELTELNIPENTNRITNYCFYNASHIKKLNLPSSIESIGYDAFTGCNSLVEVWSHKLSPPNIEDLSFSQMTYENADLYVSPQSVAEYRNADGWKNFESIKAPSVSLDVSQLSLKIGDEYKLRVIFDPEDLQVGNVEWQSSNADVIKVNEEGLIKAINIGTAIVTIKTDTGLSTNCTVTVTPIEAEEIILNETSLNILIGQQRTLQATVLPQNTSNKNITWSSSNPAVASVNQEGTINALTIGTTTVTATCGEATATCTVTVKGSSDIIITPGSDTSDSKDEDNGTGWIDGSDVYVHVNRTVNMNLTLPADLTETPTLTWALTDGGEQYVKLVPSDNTLSAAFTGVKFGETSYTVSLNGEQLLSGKVTVIAEVTMNSLLLEPATLSMAQNALPVKLETKYTPAGATMPQFSWSSSDPAVATIGNDGTVTPKSQGQTTITATALDGSGLSATCQVTVTAPIAESFEFDFDESVMGGKEGISLYIGDSYKFVPKAQDGYVLPAISWSSSDATTVSVTNNGTITALKIGEASITASAIINNYEVTASCSVTVIEPIIPEPTISPAETPTELLRKGDGTSHTFVAMMESGDPSLEAQGYRYVFGYDNASEGAATLEDTPWRYTYTTGEIYWNSANDFWVFAYYIDSEGTLHVSARRHLDGSVDEDFNPADFIGHASRSGEHIVGIFTVDGQFVGKEINALESGIYIVKTTTSSYKIIR